LPSASTIFTRNHHHHQPIKIKIKYIPLFKLSLPTFHSIFNFYFVFSFIVLGFRLNTVWSLNMWKSKFFLSSSASFVCRDPSFQHTMGFTMMITNTAIVTAAKSLCIFHGYQFSITDSDTNQISTMIHPCDVVAPPSMKLRHIVGFLPEEKEQDESCKRWFWRLRGSPSVIAYSQSDGEGSQFVESWVKLWEIKNIYLLN